MMTDKEFWQWENDIFGHGYGSGEEYILPLLKRFFEAIPATGNYDFVKLEKTVGKDQAWLLLNILHKAHDVFGYGVSTRFAWLEEKGQDLKNYLASKSAEELYEIVMKQEE